MATVIRPARSQVASVDMGLVASVILGGGQGSRLFPLTATRCKPAMPFGGKYRLIDVPISNSIHSDCRKIFILTQFLSSTLHKHVIETYRFNEFSSGFVEILTAEQSPDNDLWFQGTADAVRQYLDYLMQIPVEYILILSGDQLYNMDYREMMAFVLEKQADVVVAAQPVNETNAKRMGLLKVNEESFITDFCEKPQEKALLDQMRVPKAALGTIDDGRQFFGSMGIYLFKKEALFNLLQKDTREDFGKHLIPTQVKEGKIAAYLFDGYWEDVGTVKSFYDTNIALTQNTPPFDCFPLFSERFNLPGPKISSGIIEESILCEGTQIEGGTVKNTILGPRTKIGEGTTVYSSYIMGYDAYYTTDHGEIGQNCLIKGAILDKGVSLGNGVKLINSQGLKNYDGDGVYIRDGIIIVTRGTHLPDHFEL